MTKDVRFGLGIHESVAGPWRTALAAGSVRLAEPVFARMLRTWVATVLLLIGNAAAINEPQHRHFPSRQLIGVCAFSGCAIKVTSEL